MTRRGKAQQQHTAHRHRLVGNSQLLARFHTWLTFLSVDDDDNVFSLQKESHDEPRRHE